MAGIRINRSVVVDPAELEFGYARSSGAGGQHVNTTSTKVELRWDVRHSAALDADQKRLVAERLANRITKDGVLVLQSSEHRSQTRNKEAAVARFAALLRDALRVQASRRPTKPTRAARRRRVESKRRRGDTKALRRRPEPD